MIRSSFLGLAVALALSAQQALQSPLLPPPAIPAAGEKAPVVTTQNTGGNLSIMPTRVVLEGRTRSEEVLLRNSGKATATYRLHFVEMEMDENGQLSERPRIEGETTAADLIRFSPRQAQLAPGETQTVRIQVRKPEGLPDGEYRSHLLIQNVPEAEPPAPLDGTTDKQLSVKVTTIMGISIPVILRHGVTTGKISISDLRYWKPDKDDAPPVLSLRMSREGNRSLYGAFTAIVESGGKLKRGTVLWELPAVMIYTGLAWRNVHMPMYQGVNGDLKGTRVKITFTPGDYKGAPVVSYLNIPA